jgi:hypothetical protein
MMGGAILKSARCGFDKNKMLLLIMLHVKSNIEREMVRDGSRS